MTCLLKIPHLHPPKGVLPTTDITLSKVIYDSLCELRVSNHVDSNAFLLILGGQMHLYLLHISDPFIDQKHFFLIVDFFTSYFMRSCFLHCISLLY